MAALKGPSRPRLALASLGSLPRRFLAERGAFLHSERQKGRSRRRPMAAVAAQLLCSSSFTAAPRMASIHRGDLSSLWVRFFISSFISLPHSGSYRNEIITTRSGVAGKLVSFHALVIEVAASFCLLPTPWPPPEEQVGFVFS